MGRPHRLPGEEDACKPPEAWELCDLREGVADVPQIVEDFKAVGYQGCLSLEDFGPGEDGEKVEGQGRYLRQLLKG